MKITLHLWVGPSRALPLTAAPVCGACAAPMLITSAQFMCQHLMARAVLGARRLLWGPPEPEEGIMTWHEWWHKGAARPAAPMRAIPGTIKRCFMKHRVMR